MGESVKKNTVDKKMMASFLKRMFSSIFSKGEVDLSEEALLPSGKTTFSLDSKGSIKWKIITPGSGKGQ